MEWWGSLASTVIRNIVNPNIPEYEVQEVKTQQYHLRDIHCREDAIVLYAPDKNDDRKIFEVVLHRPCTRTLEQGFSLCRSNNCENMENRFIMYKDIVPVLVDLCPEMNNAKNIQKLCNTIVQHPSWNLAHVSAHLSLYDAFKNDIVNSYLNSSDSETGASPLQIAIQTNNLTIVNMLISAKSSLDHRDFSDNTVFHYAACSTKEIIYALGSYLPNTLNSKDKNGYSPMHLACLKDKPECVQALLVIGADVNISASASESSISTPSVIGDFIYNKPDSLKYEEVKFGGTPLHWSCSKVVINALIEKNCDINALNFKGRTALHIMVIKGRLECVSALLGHMADVNLSDNVGNTPLHLAASGSNPSIVQLLIAFNADINAKNNKGETPRHLVDSGKSDGKTILYILHAVGAKRCSAHMQGCDNGCKFDEDFNGDSPSPITEMSRSMLDKMLDVAGIEKFNSLKNRPKGGRLLCMDGGGIRGLVLVQILLEIESVLQKPITSCFDWIAGTSTGGILALQLAKGNSLKECQAFYIGMKDNVFQGSKPYSSENLEKALQETLGKYTVMSDIVHPKVMISGVLADRKPLDLHFFRNYESPSHILCLPKNDLFKETLFPEDQLIWKAARASGAAPYYFRAFGRFLDGGFIANNPTLDAITEINEYNTALKLVDRSAEIHPLSLVVTLGTGLMPVLPLDKIDVFYPATWKDTVKIATSVQVLANILVDQATASEGRVVDRARSCCSSMGVPFFRFNPQLSQEIAMDETNDAVLANMMWTAKLYMHTHQEQIRELAHVLDSISGIEE